MINNQNRIEWINSLQDSRIKRARSAGARIFNTLLGNRFPVHNFSFNPSIDDRVYGTVYLISKADVDRLTDERISFAEEILLESFQTFFPEKKISGVHLEWDDFERIEREFDGKYERYWMSL